MKQGVLLLLPLLSSCALFFYPPDFGPRDEYVIIPETVEIPAITGFMMGNVSLESPEDEQPAHPVNISSFQIGKYEVTIEEFVCFLNSSSELWYAFAFDLSMLDVFVKKHAPGFYEIIPGKERYPVFGVAWKEAQAYCRWLSEKTGDTWRLPTEAEWEYAAVGNTGSRNYPWGDVWNPAYCDAFEDGPLRVGSSTNDVSFFGVCDMARNVSEWCSDYYSPDYYAVSPVDNPKGPAHSEYGSRVFRGGPGYTFYDYLQTNQCRTTRRYDGVEQYESLGFRIVKSP